MKKLFLSILIALLPAIALATPNSITVSGAISHGNNFTITGADFGEKIPAAPMWWDDGEGASIGLIPVNTELTHVVSTLTGSDKSYTEVTPTPAIDGSAGDLYSIRYNNSWENVPQAHSHSTTYITGGHEADNSNPDCNSVYFVISPRDYKGTWYVTFKQYIPTSVHNNDVYTLQSPNWKMIMFDASSAAAGWTMQGGGGGYHYWSADDNYPFDEDDTNYYMKGSFQTTPGSYPPPSFLDQVGTWTSMTILFSTAEDDHTFEMRQAGIDVATAGCTNCNTSISTKGALAIGGYGVYDNVDPDGLTYNGMKRYFDDLYADNTYSRVVLGDAPTYSACTIIEPQIPTVWYETSITVTANFGELTDTAYLYVFDSTNDANATGVPVTLGGSVTLRNVSGNFSAGE